GLPSEIHGPGRVYGDGVLTAVIGEAAAAVRAVWTLRRLREHRAERCRAGARQRLGDAVVSRRSSCAVARLAVPPREPGVAVRVEHAAFRETYDEGAITLMLGERCAAVSGDRDEVVLSLAVSVVDDVIVHQDLFVVAVFAALAIGLHGLAEGL